MDDKEITGGDAEITSGQNYSFWTDSIESLKYNPVRENLSADVVVIGGGIAGVATAYFLAKKNVSVILLEDGYIGSGETGRTTAHLVNALDDRYSELEKYFGEDGIKLAAQSHTAALEMAGRIALEENFDCDYERLPGYLFLHPTDDKNTLDEELKASRKAGINTEMIQNPPGLSNYNGPALTFPDQAMMHPMKFLKGLCDAIIKYNGRIFTETKAAEINDNYVLTKKGLRIHASHFVIATNTPVFNTFVMHTKQAPYRTYVIGGKVPAGKLPKALWWDTGDHKSEWPTYPYHYVRLQKYDDDYDLLISGGEDHKTGQPQEENISEEMRFRNLEEWTRRHFPDMKEVVYKWSGQVMEPVDGLGYIGRNPLDANNVYVVTGDSGNGITNGIIAGMLLSDMITGVENNWSDIYNPSRKTLKTVDVFIEEQLNVAKQYLDYASSGDIKDVNELKDGEGAVIRNGISKAAVYRDEKGVLHSFTAVCPHLKCIVDWNSEEKSFDCPCHGSRFTCYGEVINGPANKNLDRIDLDK